MWVIAQRVWATCTPGAWAIAGLLVLYELRRIRRAVERPDDLWRWRPR